MRNLYACVLLTAGLVPCMAVAQTGAASSNRGWSGEVEFAYLLKRGNTNSNSLIGKFKGVYEGEEWRHTMQLEAIHTTSEDPETGETERTAERYFASYKIARKLDENNYLYNLLTYEKDAFSGYQYRASYAIGYGRTVIDTRRHLLNVEFGPGYAIRCHEPENGYGSCAVDDEGFILRAGAQYKWLISDSATFRSAVSTQVGKELGSVTRAEASLTSQINKAMSLRLSYSLKYTSEVPPGVEQADQAVTVAVVVSF